MRTWLILLFMIVIGILPAYPAMIDGPAVICDGIRGNKIGMLDDGAPARVLWKKDGWVALELKCDPVQPVPVSRTPIAIKYNLKRNIYGTYGHINTGARVSLRHDGKEMYITVYTVTGNLKEKIRYFRDYSAPFTDLNRVSFSFTGKMEKSEALAYLKKHEKGSSPGEKTGRLFVEVGYYNSIPTVVRSYEMVSSAGTPPSLEIIDFYLVNAKGYLKKYNIGHIQVKQGNYRYYQKGAYRFVKSRFDVFAPASLETEISWIIPHDAGYHRVSCTVGMTRTMEKKVKAVSIRTRNGNSGKEVFTSKASSVDDAFRKLTSHSLYASLSPGTFGIDFEKEKAWLDIILNQ